MAKALGGVVCAIGGLALFDRLVGGSFGIAALAESTAGVAPREALSLVLLGLALATLNWTVRRRIRPAEYLAALALALGFFALLRDVYHRSGYFPGDGPMRASSALIIVTLAFGILCAWAKSGLMLVFVNASTTARILRRFLLVVVIALPLLGWAQLFLQRKGWHPSEFGVALLVVCSLGVFILLMVILGARLSKSEMLRRKEEHRRRMRETDFGATFEQTAVGIAHVSVTGRFLRTNNRLSTILGYSREEFAKLSFQDITYPEDLEMDLDYFRRVLSGELSCYTTEKRYSKKDGSLVWGNLTVALLRTPAGEPKYFISVVEDISNWKRTQEELEAASKAKDRFISVISHELRTPLTPVLAALSGEIGKGQSLADPATIEMMRRNIEHETSIINDLLDLTRISSSGKLKLELRPVDLHVLIEEVLLGIDSALHSKGLSCRLLLNAPRHIVNGDPIRLRQIFLNLLDNAMKFTPPGGIITLETSMDKERRGSCDPIHIRVADTGVGIEPGNLERIFDAFEQGKQSIPRRYGGLGLGLAIVRGLVEAHGGTIRAESSGGGAEFFFDLCLTDQSVTKPEIRSANEVKQVRILLVEDHEDTRVTLQRLLERRGHTVRTASGVAEAVELFRHHPFDLVISDIGLPDGSGLDIPVALRSDGHGLPSIALSGFGTEDDIQKSLRAGFSHHLTKPVEMSILDAAIVDIMSRGAGRN